MRYDEISKKSNDEIKEIILRDCKKFYNEFIKNGYEVYRKSSIEKSFNKISTQETRKPLGWMNGHSSDLIEYIDKILFVDNGCASRIKNSVFTITGDYNHTATGILGRAFWCVPIGDYTFSYVPGIYDFNYTNKETQFIKVANTHIQHLFGSYELSLDEFKKAIECRIEELDNVVASLFEIETLDEDEDSIEFRDSIKTIRGAIEKIPSVYITNKVSGDLHTPTEILFNCSQYYMLSVEDYDLMEIFDINTKIINKNRFDTIEKQFKEINLNPKNIKKLLSTGFKVDEDVMILAVSKEPDLLIDILTSDIMPSEDVIIAAVENKGRLISKLISFDIPITDNIIKAAVKNDGSAIQFFQDTSDDIKMLALKNKARAILWIDNPSYDLIKYALSQDGSLLRNLIRFINDDELIITAIEEDTLSITHVEEQSFRVAKYAIDKYFKEKNHMGIMSMITNKEAIKYAVEKHKDAYEYIAKYFKTDEIKKLYKDTWGNI
jgi:hypothetical protein